jgi:hypothetical protein
MWVCDMIFIQLVVWFLSPRQGSLDKNHITSQNMEDPIFINLINDTPVA